MSDPTNVPGLLYRWRADSIAQANSTAVSSWTDSVGSVALTQATGGLQPLYIVSGINGLPIVRFDGNDDTLAATITSRTQQYTFAIVGQSAVVPTSGRQLVWSGAEILSIATGLWEMWSGASLDGGSVTTSPTLTVCQFNSVSSNLYLNGNLSISGDAGTGATGTALQIGNHSSISRPWNGDVAEVLLYDHGLTAGERAELGTYTQDRYAITVADYTGGPPNVIVELIHPI